MIDSALIASNGLAGLSALLKIQPVVRTHRTQKECLQNLFSKLANDICLSVFEIWRERKRKDLVESRQL